MAGRLPPGLTWQTCHSDKGGRSVAIENRQHNADNYGWLALQGVGPWLDYYANDYAFLLEL